MTTDWAEVYRSTYPELLRFLHRKVWDEDRAKDLAQEAFARALGYDPEKPRSLVFQIAANLATDEARLVVRRKRHLALLKVEEEAAAETAESAASPAQELEASERVENLRRALEALSERDREVLLLWDAGLNYADIAEQTGLSQGAIGTTLSRAKRRLVESYDALENEHAALG